MAFVLKDRVKETSTTAGTGALTLAGVPAGGFQPFSVIGDGNSTYYTITDGTDWEVGMGTYTLSGTTLSRDVVIDSSNSGNLVNWGSDLKDVFVTYPADKSVYSAGPIIKSQTGAVYTNQTTIAENSSLPIGSNGFSVGPITIEDGVTFSVPPGQTWVVI
jgi:hypothetical protein